MSVIDMAAAFITALLAGTGIGGGGLYVIYLTAVKSMEQSDAQAINLIFFMAAAVCALPFHAKKYNLVFKSIAPCAVLGCIGTIFGGFLRKSIDADTLQMLFGILLIGVGISTLIGKFGKNMHKRPSTEEN